MASHSSPSEEQHQRSTEVEPSDLEKETLAAYEGHDADIPSNEGFVSIEEPQPGQSLESTRRNSHTTLTTGQSSQDIGHIKANPSVDADADTDVEKVSGQTSAASEDTNIVWWDGPDDPENPMNYGSVLKVTTIALVSAICFVTPLASSMFAPGVPQLMKEFESTNVELGSFVVSIYILGFAVGPLFFAPLSEIYGRLPVYHVCNVLFIVFTIACARATSLNMLIGFRLLAGTFGSAPLVNGGGSIADIIVQEKRGVAMAFFAMGPMMGPVIGPVAGGYLTEAMGWRWVFYLLTILAGVNVLLGFIFMRETYAPVILSRKARRLQKETGNMELRSKLDSGLTPKQFFTRAIIRPAKLLIFSPIVLATSLYVGIVYGYLYLLFTTFATVFEGSYHFSSGAVGLTFMGMGVGSLMGLGLFAWSSDWLLKSKAKKAEAIAEATGQPSGGLKPEYRLPPMLLSTFLIPAGLFIYGWTTEYHVHYMVPIIFTGLIGCGNIAVFMAITVYLVDAFHIYAASALAANTVIRSIMGAALPLAGQKMYDALGLGWGNSLLAFISIATIPVPFGLVKWGEEWRKKWPVKNL